MAEMIDLLNLVRAFQEAVNEHNVDKVMEMFTDNAQFELVGISKYSGKKEIRNVFDYDAGVNTQLKFIDCKSEGNKVNCKFIERNDRLSAIGIDELEYPVCTILFRDRLIENFSAEISPEMVQYNTEVWQKFMPWFSQNYPDEYSKMITPEGRFIYNRENGADVVPLLRKWREEQEKH